MMISDQQSQNAQPLTSGCHSCQLYWRGYTIQIRVTQDAYNLSRYGVDAVTHLEIRSIEPVNVALPMTETGYKSLFLPSNVLDGYDSAKDVVRLWLDEAAQSDAWIEQEFNDRQMTLF